MVSVGDVTRGTCRCVGEQTTVPTLTFYCVVFALPRNIYDYKEK